MPCPSPTPQTAIKCNQILYTHKTTKTLKHTLTHTTTLSIFLSVSLSISHKLYTIQPSKTWTKYHIFCTERLLVKHKTKPKQPAITYRVNAYSSAWRIRKTTTKSIKYRQRRTIDRFDIPIFGLMHQSFCCSCTIALSFTLSFSLYI